MPKHSNDVQLMANSNLNEIFAELEKIVKEFEQGEVDLESGIPKFRRAIELGKYLKKRLTEMENELEEVKLTSEDKSKDEGENG